MLLTSMKPKPIVQDRPACFTWGNMTHTLPLDLRKSPLALLVLVLGLGVVFSLWQYAVARNTQGAREQFMLHAGDVQHAIRQRIVLHLEILRGAQGLFAASNEVTHSEWRRYVEVLQLARFPDIEGIGYIRYLPLAGKSGFEQGKQHDTAYLVEYFDPLLSGQNIPVLDQGDEKLTLELARDTGLPTASGILTSSGNPRHVSFMMVLPVYRQDKPHITTEQRRDALLGFVYTQHSVGVLIHHAVGTTLLQELKFDIFDGGDIDQTSGKPDGAHQLYGADEANPARAASKARFNTELPLEVAGREWLIRFSSLPTSRLGALDSVMWWILSSGILVTVAASFIILILSTERQRAMAQMRQQKSLISQVLDALPINIFLKNKDWRYVMVNKQCARLLGMEKQAVVGKTDFDVFPLEVAGKLRADDEAVQVAKGLMMREEKLVSAGKELFALAGKTMITLADSEDPLLLGFSIDITERRQMEGALRESEERLRSILDNSPAVIFVKDLEGRYLLANRQHARLVGIGSGQIIGKTDYDCFPKESADSYRENDLQVLAGGSAIEFEEHAPQEDGLHTYLSVKFPLHNADGEPYAVCGISTDITARLQLERKAARAHANQLSRALTDAVGEGLIGVDMWHRVVFANPRAQMLLGIDEADIMGKNLDDIVHAVTGDGNFLSDTSCPPWAMVAEGKTFQADDWSFSKHGGSRFPVNVVIAPVFDNAFITGAVMSFQDITARKRVESALARAEQQQRAFLDNLPEMAWFKDRNSHYLMVNEATSKACGFAPEEMVGMTDLDLWPEEIARTYRADDLDVMKNGKQKRVEEPFEGKDGKRIWIETIKSPIFDENGQVIGTVGTARDVTQRKLDEEALKNHVSELARMNAELDEFTYIASHDLQEPLRKLLAFSDWLRRDLGDALPPRAAKDIGFITESAARMQSLVQDLLTLSRAGKTSMVREWVALDEVVDRALNALELRIQDSGAEIGRDPLPSVLGDPILLTQLYQNLIGNAIKFVSCAPPRVYLTSEHLNGEFVLGVKDNGIGIKPEHAREIFQPFKRLHGRGEYDGSGIGLSICRKVIERHHGRIWVESEEGFGAHFKFVLQVKET